MKSLRLPQLGNLIGGFVNSTGGLLEQGFGASTLKNATMGHFCHKNRDIVAESGRIRQQIHAICSRDTLLLQFGHISNVFMQIGYIKAPGVTMPSQSGQTASYQAVCKCRTFVSLPQPAWLTRAIASASLSF
jgi:hypothetical protein